MKNRLIILFFLIAGWYSSLAQSSLGIDSINFSAPASASYNSQYLFKVNVVNYGPQFYSGTVDMQYAIDSTGTGVNMVDTSNSHVVGCSIAVGASQPDSAMITIGSSFRNGINTVVIWPRTMDAFSTTRDSLKINFIVIISGIENFAESRPIIFPNPASQSIQVFSNSSKFAVEQVRILDLMGQLIYTEKFKGILDVSLLSSGAYFMELINSAGATVRYKVIKE